MPRQAVAFRLSLPSRLVDMDTINIPAALSAELVGRYVVEREVGSGGMASVYLANDIRHDRRVALKVFRCLDRRRAAAICRDAQCGRKALTVRTPS
jgi:hypothetical protein